MLKVSGLNKSFQDGLSALREINFEINRGDFVSIVGLSGSGKSTLLKCLNRTIQPTCGRIILKGVDITSLEESDLKEIKKKIGMISQQFNLINKYSVLTNVLTGALGRLGILSPILNLWPKELRDQALNYLGIVGIREKCDSSVDTLSGGQRQRVAMARALMQEPELFLADEPIANLDPITASVVMDYLHQINQKYGLTILCTLHTLELARHYSSRIIAMQRGQIIFDRQSRDFHKISKELVYSEG